MATERYRKGQISLAEASTIAKVNLWQMIDYLNLHNIRPPPEKFEDIEEELH